MIQLLWYSFIISVSILNAAAAAQKPSNQAAPPEQKPLVMPTSSQVQTPTNLQPSSPAPILPAPQVLSEQKAVAAAKPPSTVKPVDHPTTAQHIQSIPSVTTPPPTLTPSVQKTEAIVPQKTELVIPTLSTHEEPLIKHTTSQQHNEDAEQHELEHTSHEPDITAMVPYQAATSLGDITLERTFALIKPHAVAAHHIGRILALIEDNKFTIVALKLHRFSKQEAETFYGVHRDKAFFAPLVELMTSGPSILMVLDRPHAVAAWRELAGATDPQEARPGTIRAMYGESKQNNAVHGSDSLEAAIREIQLCFPELSNPHKEEHGLSFSEELDADDSLSLAPPEFMTQQSHPEHTENSAPSSYQF